MQPQSDANTDMMRERCPSAVAACAPSLDVPNPAVDANAIRATIRKALIERSMLPRYEDLCVLHGDLVKHIQALLPLAERQIDRLWHGSVEWYSKRSQLSYVRTRWEPGWALGCNRPPGT